MYLNFNLIKILHRRNITLKYHKKFTYKGNDLTPINLKLGEEACVSKPKASIL
jgi:hypothetical protein